MTQIPPQQQWPKTGWRSLVLVVVVSVILGIVCSAAVLMNTLLPYNGADSAKHLSEDLRRAVADKNVVTLATMIAPSERTEAKVAGRFYKTTMRAHGQDPDWSLTDTLSLVRATTRLLDTLTVDVSDWKVQSQMLGPKLARLQTSGNVKVQINDPDDFWQAWQGLAQVLSVPPSVVKQWAVFGIASKNPAGGENISSAAKISAAELAKRVSAGLEKRLNNDFKAGLLAVKDGNYWYISAMMTWFENGVLAGKTASNGAGTKATAGVSATRNGESAAMGVVTAAPNYQADWDNPDSTAEDQTTVVPLLSKAMSEAAAQHDFSNPHVAKFFPSGTRRLLLVYGRSYYQELAGNGYLLGILPIPTSETQLQQQAQWTKSPQGVTLSLIGTALSRYQNCGSGDKQTLKQLTQQYAHPILVQLYSCM